jgi:AraC-like DNA-binding protein
MKPAEGRKTREIVKYWRTPYLPEVELLHAHYTGQSFSRHAHDSYAIGVIEQGALSFSYRGETWIAPAGQVNLAVPGEAHTGNAATDIGWTYRMFYIDPELMRQVSAAITGCPARLPFFAAGVINDAKLAEQIRSLHRDLEENKTARLEQEEALWALLTALILRHAEQHRPLSDPGRENLSVKRVREYMEAHFAENFSIRDLAEGCNLSPFYLIRAFRAGTGVPPHVYQQQIRVRRAKELMAQGYSATFAAQETGFADQSHFSRRFRQITGMTPGQYRNFVQFFR